MKTINSNRYVAIGGIVAVSLIGALTGCNKESAPASPPPTVSNGTVMPKAGAPNGPTPEMMQRDKENAAKAAQASKQAEAGLKSYLEGQKK